MDLGSEAHSPAVLSSVFIVQADLRAGLEPVEKRITHFQRPELNPYSPVVQYVA